MDEPTGKLGKLREAVEKKELEQDEPRQSQANSERVLEIIKRLKAGESVSRASSKLDSNIESIRERVSDSQEAIRVSLRGGGVSAAAGARVGAALGAVGGFYSSLKAPIDKITNFIADIPLTENLQENLEAGGINIPPDEYLIIVSAAATASFISVILLFGSVSLVLADASLAVLSPLIAICSSVLVIVIGIIYPSMMANERATRINRELPFALRQLATQIKAGVSFHKALGSIVNSHYGALGEEFGKLQNDIERGYSTEQALLRLMARTKSRGLKKSCVQILRALKSGGNLSDTIGSIADDVAFELRMKVRDFTEKLNFISVIYIMVGVVGPVVVTILSSIAQLPLIGGNFPFEYIVIIFAAIVLMMCILLFIINRMEPG
ncbi:MAG: type II secretion system F family protein [Candidatus Micrarchaeota archaeon]